MWSHFISVVQEQKTPNKRRIWSCFLRDLPAFVTSALGSKARLFSIIIIFVTLLVKSFSILTKILMTGYFFIGFTFFKLFHDPGNTFLISILYICTNL